jgi:hypothetical protein
MIYERITVSPTFDRKYVSSTITCSVKNCRARKNVTNKSHNLERTRSSNNPYYICKCEKQ